MVSMDENAIAPRDPVIREPTREPGGALPELGERGAGGAVRFAHEDERGRVVALREDLEPVPGPVEVVERRPSELGARAIEVIAVAKKDVPRALEGFGRGHRGNVSSRCGRERRRQSRDAEWEYEDQDASDHDEAALLREYFYRAGTSNHRLLEEVLLAPHHPRRHVTRACSGLSYEDPRAARAARGRGGAVAAETVREYRDVTR